MTEEPFTDVSSLSPDSEETGADVSDLPTSYHVVLYAVGAPCGVAAAVGNTLLIIAIIRFAKLQTQTNVVVANLAVADMMGGILLLVHIGILHRYDIMGEDYPYACYLWASLQLMPMSAGFLHLGLVSVDRLVAVTRAVHYDDEMSARRMKLYAVCLWGYIIMATVIAYAFMDHDDPTFSICDMLILPKGYVMLILFGHVIPCCLIIIGIFLWLKYTLSVHQRKIQVTNTLTYNILLADYTSAKLFFTTFVVTIALWLMFVVTNVVWFAGVETSALYLVIRITYLVGSLSHNKYLVYVILDVDFKKAIVKAVSCSKKPPQPLPKRPSKC